MRKDMYKVLHDTRRVYENTRGIRPQRMVDGESLEPTHESMRERHVQHWGGKEGSLRLAPLRRFIESRVGQPWDQVFSEISKTITKRDSLLTDLLRYLNVEADTWLEDGKVMMNCPYRGPKDAVQYSDFYVHPQTRILCAGNWRKGAAALRRQNREEREAALLARRRILDANTQLHRVDGVWYEVTLEATPSKEEIAAAESLFWDDPQARYKWKNAMRHDAVLGQRVSGYNYAIRREMYDSGQMYAKSKRQLSHKELKLYGLLDAIAVA